MFSSASKAILLGMIVGLMVCSRMISAQYDIVDDDPILRTTLLHSVILFIFYYDMFCFFCICIFSVLYEVGFHLAVSPALYLIFVLAVLLINTILYYLVRRATQARRKA